MKRVLKPQKVEKKAEMGKKAKEMKKILLIYIRQLKFI